MKTMFTAPLATLLACSQPAAPARPSAPTEPSTPAVLLSELEPEMPKRFGVPRFTLSGRRTVVWVVFGDGGDCRELVFARHTSQSPDRGFVVIDGLGVSYTIEEDQIDFHGTLWDPFGKALGSSTCHTVAKLSADGRLGGADLFHDQAECEAAQSTAVALDDSVEKMRTKCDGATLDIEARNIECGVDGRYSGSGRGCFEFAARLIEHHAD